MTREEKLAQAIETFLGNHSHEERRERGCKCGGCYEVDPNCPCFDLAAALTTKDDLCE
jgi:hypothetical protein